MTTELHKSEKVAEIEAIRAHEIDGRARLEELLADRDEEVRAEAAAAVWEFPDDLRLVETVLTLTVEDKSPRVRAKAASALGRVLYEGDMAGADEPGYEPDALMGEPPADLYRRVRDLLLARAGDDTLTLDERRFALEGVAFLGSPAVLDLIEAFWRRAEPAARLSALFAMGRSGHPRWSNAILEALAGSDRELRLQAIWAAGEAEVQPARDPLVTLVRDPSGNREERLAAIEAIARLAGEPCAAALLSLAETDPDPEVREAASVGLEEIALLDSLEEDEPDQHSPDAPTQQGTESPR